MLHDVNMAPGHLHTGFLRYAFSPVGAGRVRGRQKQKMGPPERDGPRDGAHAFYAEKARVWVTYPHAAVNRSRISHNVLL